MTIILEKIYADDIINILIGKIDLDTDRAVTRDISFTELGLEPIDLLSLCFYSGIRAGDYFSGEALNERGEKIFHDIASKGGMGKAELDKLNIKRIDADRLLGSLTPEIWAEFVNYKKNIIPNNL